MPVTHKTTLPIRVAQVAPSIFPVPPADHGGTERIVHDLSVALMRAGLEVTLFAPSDSAAKVPQVGKLPSLLSLERKYAEVPPSTPSVLEAVRMEELRQEMDRFDIIHCHGEFFHAALLGQKRRQSVTTIHWRVDQLDRTLFFDAFPDLPVVAISKAQSDMLPAANRAGIVHHGIDAGRYAPGPGDGGYVAFIGRMTDQKRPDRAIRVARAAGRTIRLAGTIDVGNPRYFEEQVQPLLGPDAIYEGPLDDRAKQSLLQGAEALLFPIDWPEPFGLVMIESMACGTPVIGWRAGSVPEVVEDGVTGFVVASKDEAVQALGRIRGLDRQRVREAFDARFTSDHMAQAYIALYRKLLGS